jgi:hypothetical protein
MYFCAQIKAQLEVRTKRKGFGNQLLQFFDVWILIACGVAPQLLAHITTGECQLLIVGPTFFLASSLLLQN